MRILFRSAAAAAMAACGVLAAAGSAQAQAQFPRARPGQFEVRGLDFRPQGAWRHLASEVRATRQRLLAAKMIPSLNRASPTAYGAPKVTGHFYFPVVPIAFSNVPAPAYATPAALQDKLFHNRTSDAYSVKTFYEQMSNGNIQLDGHVFPWTAAPQTDLYYEDGCNGIGVSTSCPNATASGYRLGEYLVYGLQQISSAADSASVWAAYDNDGPDGVPSSGDDDGYVDVTVFLQPEIDGACQTSNLWAHRYVISGVNGGSPFVTKTPWAGHPGQFLKVQDYTLQSAQGGNTSCTSGQIMAIGTVAHETGHAFGLPDLYDTGASQTEGIGEWGLMGSGNYARPYSPSHMEAWSLFQLGWIAVDTIKAGATVRLGPIQTSDTALIVPIAGTSEYVLLENRQALESDTAMFNSAWAGRYKQPGLLIWHVDQGRLDAGMASNSVNAGSIYALNLVEADGHTDLHKSVGAGGNRGDAGDAFGIDASFHPGAAGNHTFTAVSSPANLTNAGQAVAFSIDSIYEVTPGGPGAIVFRFRLTEGPPPPAVTAQQAADALLGRGTLTTQQTAYLDSIGNKNGAYDLGDFLAYLDQTGQTVSPAVMTRLMRKE